MKRLLLLILLLLPIVSYSLCLGIFEDKHVCKAWEAFEKDAKTCTQYSYSLCRGNRHLNENSVAFCKCLSLHAKNCIASLGWDRSLIDGGCYNHDY